jgi:phosphoenolpyruvate phosphomutase
VSAQERKTSTLRGLLRSQQTHFALEAHSGVAARIAEEAGFRAIWASGLGISAQCGVRDHNELSSTQVLEIVEFMADATRVPILVDGDTGFGDFNNVRRLVRKLERCGAAGVCIEDKLFPKTNSFIQGERQPLADVDEFCGKIKAGKDSHTDEDFCVVARVEALIAGFGLDEALRRASAYHAAGADAVLIHSKRADPSEILAFAEAWQGRCPLVIVPTTYASTPSAVFRRAGIRLVVWGNALIRASVAAMQRVARAVQEGETLIDVEADIASVAEIFRLQGADELLQAERLYAPSGRPQPRVVILGATRGEGLEAVTAQRPKVMLPVAGRPLLRHLVDCFKAEGLHAIHVVAGYKPEAIDAQGVQLLRNPDYATSGELCSLRCAGDALGDDAVVLYGDLLFRGYVLRDLLRVDAEVVAVVDSASTSARSGRLNDLAYCSAPDDRALYGRKVRLERVGSEPNWRGRAPDGRWIGIARFQGRAVAALRGALGDLERRADFPQLGMPDLLNALVTRGLEIAVLYIHGHWLDVNNLEDLERAQVFAQAHRMEGGTR